ncbi:outer membrane biogenesis protein BamB [Planctomycetes bacterium Pan216]|uniref:Outer membrane biogenesis protein BamB n=1 Tax=Kolteria novifilia TaxID=2527975 RepID=A0A518B037_9BACT|nr:outer membrane biogenesis protein BamB [Planctomycetes bacterium Pan216]
MLQRTLLGLLLVFSSLANAEEGWNRFRGPDGTGISATKGIPVEFGDDTNVAWKTPIHGRGWSSPVLLDDQLWMTTATEDGRKMYGVCVDKNSGKIVHDLLIFENAEPRFCHPENSYASPTPAIDEGRVYLHFGSYGTACVDPKTGKILWSRRDLECDHFRGPGSSPIIHGDLLFANYDGVDVQYVVALDKHSGKTVWKKERAIDYGTDNGDMKKAYGTPALIEYAGREQLVSPAAIATIAYDPSSGEELWKLYHGGYNVAAVPLFSKGLVFIAPGGRGNGMVAVRPDGQGDVSDSHLAWSLSKGTPKRPSPILFEDHLYIINDEGIASCIEAATGKLRWQKRLRGKYWASPVLIDGNVYGFSKEGRVPVFRASPEKFESVAENRFEDGFNSTPAVDDEAMYPRTFTHLYRIEKKDH